MQEGQYGPAYAETGGRLRITLPADAHSILNSPNNNHMGPDMFSMGYLSATTISGDFDLQVEYYLPVWPGARLNQGSNPWRVANGVRLGLSVYTGSSEAVVERSGSEQDGDKIGVVTTGGPFQWVPCGDLSGSMRLTRQGNVVRAYYSASPISEGMSWTELVTGNPTPVGTGPVHIRVATWSHDYVFCQQETVVEFDNLMLKTVNYMVSVKKMQNASNPTIILADKTNNLITPTSSDFPPEVMTPEIRDPEKVTFALSEALYEELTLIAEGVDADQNVVYKTKDVVFPSSETEATVTWGTDDITFPYITIHKTDLINWHLVNPSDANEYWSNAEKTIFFILKQNLQYNVDRPETRIEIMELVCSLARGLSSDRDIRAALEDGLYDTYKQVVNPPRGKYYSTPGHYDILTRAFNLTGFLADDIADCADMSIMHKLTCNALGVPQECLRLVSKQAVKQGKKKFYYLSVVPASECLGTKWPALGTGVPLQFTSGWHQVSYFSSTKGKKNLEIYDPLIRYQLQPGGDYVGVHGMPQDQYQNLFMEKSKWSSFFTALTNVY